MAVARPSLHLRSRRSAPGMPPIAGPAAGPSRPGAGYGARRALAAEVVLQPLDVVELGRRDLDQLDAARRASKRWIAAGRRRARASPGPSSQRRTVAVVVLEVQPQPAATGRRSTLLLALVALERQPPARLDHDDLAAVAVGQRPDQLVAPRLVDAAAARRPSVDRSRPRTSRSPATTSSSRSSADVASV